MNNEYLRFKNEKFLRGSATNLISPDSQGFPFFWAYDIIFIVHIKSTAQENRPLVFS